MRAESELEELNQQLDRDVNTKYGTTKVKPNVKLKEMQCMEKLVAINERIEEAQNYRKKLKDFEITEAERVQREREQLHEKQR